MDIIESLLTRADWHASHRESGPPYCYTAGDQKIDRKAAAEIKRLREDVRVLRAANDDLVRALSAYEQAVAEPARPE